MVFGQSGPLIPVVNYDTFSPSEVAVLFKHEEKVRVKVQGNQIHKCFSKCNTGKGYALVIQCKML